MILATGHPAGPILLYVEVGRLLAHHGVTVLRPREGFSWDEGRSHHQVRYLHGVAVLTEGGGTKHTHAPVPMEWMLDHVRPDLVLADHGFAFPMASSLVQLAHAQALREQFVQPNEIRPLYLRLPDVDIGWSTRDGRISG